MFEMSLGSSGLNAMERIICLLERGTLITKFYSRKKPESKFLILRRETRQVGNVCIIIIIIFFYSFFSASARTLYNIEVD